MTTPGEPFWAAHRQWVHSHQADPTLSIADSMDPLEALYECRRTMFECLEKMTPLMARLHYDADSSADRPCLPEEGHRSYQRRMAFYRDEFNKARDCHAALIEHFLQLEPLPGPRQRASVHEYQVDPNRGAPH